MNNLPGNQLTNAKLFADDTSLFSVDHDITTSFFDLNFHVNKVKEWVFHLVLTLQNRLKKLYLPESFRN